MVAKVLVKNFMSKKYFNAEQCILLRHLQRGISKLRNIMTSMAIYWMLICFWAKIWILYSFTLRIVNRNKYFSKDNTFLKAVF